MGKLFNLYRFGINTLANMHLDSQNTVKYLLDEHIAFVLTLLPKGTKHHSTEQMTISGLSIDYVLAFEHPYFPDGIKLELDYTRVAWPGQNNDKYEEGNIFTGIRYLTGYGTPWDLNRDFKNLGD